MRVISVSSSFHFLYDCLLVSKVEVGYVVFCLIEGHVYKALSVCRVCS